MRKRIVQDITAIVLRSDKDNDQRIDPKEAQELALKISLQLQAYDVGFDTKKFVKVVAKDPSVSGVIGIVLKLLPRDDIEEESVVVDDAIDSDEDSDDEDDEETELYGEFGCIIWKPRLHLNEILLMVHTIVRPCRYVLRRCRYTTGFFIRCW